jgi:hypothetical protein
MHAKDTADLPADIAELVLIEPPNGQAAWLRPASAEAGPPRPLSPDCASGHR